MTHHLRFVVVAVLVALAIGTPVQAQIDRLRVLAEAGDAEAQAELGSIYEISNVPGVKNEAESARWFRLAADQGHRYALYKMGAFYRRGEGVPQDYAEAARYYRLAVAQGDRAAKSDLQDMVRRGEIDALPIPTVTATTLVSTYDDNELRGDQQFKLQVVRVTGVVTDIARTISGTPYIRMSERLPLPLGRGVTCELASTAVGSAAQLSTGQNVALEG